MEFTFLGTSSGIPTKQRNVSGLALRVENAKGWYLVDCGEGTQHQLLHLPYTLKQLAAVFITHIHGDHCYGLPGLLASAGMAGRSDALTIIAPRPLEEFIAAVVRCTALQLPYELRFIAVEDLNEAWLGVDVTVSRVELSHRVPSYAYVFTEKNIEKKLNIDKLRQQAIPAGPVWGQLQRGEDVKLDDGRTLASADYLMAGRKPRRIIVGGDNDAPELLRAVCENTHVLIHEATYTEAVSERVGPAPQHSSAAKVAKFAQSAALPNLVLTHFSARYQQGSDGGPSVADLEQEALAFYRGNLFMARDLDKYVLNRKGDCLKYLPAKPRGYRGNTSDC